MAGPGTAGEYDGHTQETTAMLFAYTNATQETTAMLFAYTNATLLLKWSKERTMDIWRRRAVNNRKS